MVKTRSGLKVEGPPGRAAEGEVNKPPQDAASPRAAPVTPVAEAKGRRLERLDRGGRRGGCCAHAAQAGTVVVQWPFFLPVRSTPVLVPATFLMFTPHILARRWRCGGRGRGCFRRPAGRCRGVRPPGRGLAAAGPALRPRAQAGERRWAALDTPSLSSEAALTRLRLVSPRSACQAASAGRQPCACRHAENVPCGGHSPPCRSRICREDSDR